MTASEGNEMIVFVIGNGTSRQGISLHELKKHGKIYGCNRLYQEFECDVLVSVDVAISKEIQASGYAQAHVHYVRDKNMVAGSGSLPVSDKNDTVKWHGMSSGPTAMMLAGRHGATEAYLVGFDLLPLPNGLINNIYAGTPCYQKAGSKGIPPGTWEAEMERVMIHFPNTKYIRVYDGYHPPLLTRQSNYKMMRVDAFRTKFNV